MKTNIKIFYLLKYNCKQQSHKWDDQYMDTLVINLAREVELINLSSELHFDLGLIRPIFHSGEHD